MKFLYSLAGANVPVIKDFDCYENEAVNEGELVFLDMGGKATKNTSNTVLGVCAETHTGKEDILNERSNKNNFRVDVTQGGVYEVCPQTVTVIENGTGTSLVCSDQGLENAYDGAKLVLIKKGEGSTNNDSIGCVRDVIGGMRNDGKVNFTLNAGGTVCMGDVYAFLPSCGKTGSIKENTDEFVLANTYEAKARIVGRNLAKCKLEVVFTNKAFN